MIQLGNGRSQAKPEQPKPGGRFTGQRLKLLRPEAEPRQQVPYDHICRKLRVSEHTLKAIEKAESLSIAEKKQRLLDKALRIASKNRRISKIGQPTTSRSVRSFIVATKIGCDSRLAR